MRHPGWFPDGLGVRVLGILDLDIFVALEFAGWRYWMVDLAICELCLEQTWGVRIFGFTRLRGLRVGLGGLR